MSSPIQEDFRAVLDRRDEMVTQLEVEGFGTVELLAECEEIQSMVEEQEGSEEHACSVTRS